VITDSQGGADPFCLENGKVVVLDENEMAYLVQVVAQGKTLIGRYFIIPKEHIESVLERPDTWTRYENELLLVALGLARNDQELMSKLDGTDPHDAMNLNWNNGVPKAGGRVRHSHLWVIFRYDGLDVGLDGAIERVLELQANEVAFRERIASLEFKVMEYEAETTALRRQCGLQLNGN